MPQFPESLSQAQIGYVFRARASPSEPVIRWRVVRVVRSRRVRGVTFPASGGAIRIHDPGGVWAIPADSDGKQVFFEE